MCKRWLACMLLLVIPLFFNGSGAFVGVNIGTDVSNMPSAVEVVAFLKVHQIKHVRLYDADAHMLQALSNTSIEVVVGITNEELLKIGESPSMAAAWVNKNVVPYFPMTNITAIAVGSEVLSVIPDAAPILMPAMNYIHSALVAANINFQVKVSTPLSTDIIPKPFPPSAASFNSYWNTTIYQLLQFLKNTKSYYMLNAYPYYGYTEGDGIFPIEYALFQPLPAVKQIVDPNTLFRYNSMFDAMVDATYYSMQVINFSTVPIVVTESGWPSQGGADEPDATLQNAETYNNNMIKRVMNGTGPPSKPSVPINVYIYEMFNEDKRSGPLSEKNWGVFTTNGTAVYPLNLVGNQQTMGNGSPVFCIAKDGANSDKLQAGINWACGQGHANCTAIQPGQPCYFPDNLKSHASYAYNDYYQKMNAMGGTCDFDGTATTTSVDPSYGKCAYAGSSKSSIRGENSTPTAFGPISATGGSLSLKQSRLKYLFFALPSVLLLL